MKTIQFVLLILLMGACKKAPVNLSTIRAKTIVVDSSVKDNQSINELVNPYKKQLLNKMQEGLTYTATDLTREDGEMQSSLGNLFADICFVQGDSVFTAQTTHQLDFALFNHGGLRASIPSGDVTLENAFNLMPFENELVVVTLSGEKVHELASFFIDNQRAHPISNAVQFTITGNTYKLLINNRPLDKKATYNVLTNDYLQTGGDKMNFFKNPIELYPLDYKVRDAIIDFFKKTDTLKATLDNRVIVKK